MQLQREEARLRTLINVAKPSLMPELKLSTELMETSSEPTPILIDIKKETNDKKDEEAVKKDTNSNVDSPVKPQQTSSQSITVQTATVKLTTTDKQERNSKRPVMGPLLSPHLLQQLKKEEEKEKEAADDDEALSEKSGLVIRKRKKCEEKSPKSSKAKVLLSVH